MTTERDFDRIARAWLELGPDEAPDRAIAAVTTAVETTPQVRPWRRWLVWRLPTVSRLPLLVSLAALIVIVLGAIALTGGRPIPSASPTAVPDALIARWTGEPRFVIGTDPPTVGTTLTVAADSFALSRVNQLGTPETVSTASLQPDGTTLRLVADERTAGCVVGDIGDYKFLLSASGRTLTLDPVNDACPTRSAALAGAWPLEACTDSNPDAGCLGDLDAGTYGSQYFSPEGRPDLDYGQLRYSVPVGWSNGSDWPSTYGLEPIRPYNDGFTPRPRVAAIEFYARPALADQSRDCSALETVPAVRSVTAIVEGLRSLPSITVSEPTAIEVNGLEGQWLDVTVDPGWTESCPGETRPGTVLLTEIGEDPEGWVYGIVRGDSVRLVFIQLSPTTVVLVAMRTVPDERPDPFAPEAMPIVESLVFE